MQNFDELFGNLIFFIIFFSLITIFIIYGYIKQRKFIKYGVPVSLKVKNVKEETINDTDGRTIRIFYTITFEFSFNGEIIEKEINTKRKFKVGTIKKGLYLPCDKYDNISVEGQGFHFSSSGVIFLIIFELLVFFVIFGLMYEIPIMTYITVIVIFFAILLIVGNYVIPMLKRRKNEKLKEKSETEQIYYKETYDMYSSVAPTLIRYSPRVKSIKLEKNKKPDFLSIIFICGGLFMLIHGFFALCLGMKYIFELKTEYSHTYGEIKEIYKDEKDKAVIVYKYSILDNDYIIDYKTDFDKELIRDKVGDREKIYYKIDNPEEGVSKTEIKWFYSYMCIFLIMGLIFFSYGINIERDDKIKYRIYKKYLIWEE